MIEVVAVLLLLSMGIVLVREQQQHTTGKIR